MKFKSLEELQQLLPEGAKPPPPPPPGKGDHDGRGKTVRLQIERKGRKGKTVTLVLGLRHNPDTMADLARLLKERCGTGGTVKEGTIELQGDQRDRAKAELETLNYVVK